MNLKLTKIYYSEKLRLTASSVGSGLELNSNRAVGSVAWTAFSVSSKNIVNSGAPRTLN